MKEPVTWARRRTVLGTKLLGFPRVEHGRGATDRHLDRDELGRDLGFDVSVLRGATDRHLDRDELGRDLGFDVSVLLVGEEAGQVDAILGRDGDGDGCVGRVEQVDAEHGTVLVSKVRVIACSVLQEG